MKEDHPIPPEIEFPPLVEIDKYHRKYDVPFCDTKDPIEAYEKETKRINLFFIYQVLALFCIAVMSVYAYSTQIIYLSLLATLFIVLAFFEGAK